MKVFLIIVAVLAVIIIAVLSLSATVTLVYDKGWHTKVQILFIEKDIVLSKILSFILFPEKKAEQVVKESDEKKKSKKDSKSKKKESTPEKVAEAAVEACKSESYQKFVGYPGHCRYARFIYKSCRNRK